MSSREVAKVKRASGTPRNLVSRGSARGSTHAASDEGMSGEDKANFIKAMMEGVKNDASAPKARSKTAAGNRKAASTQKPKTQQPKTQKPQTAEILRKIPAPQQAAARPTNPQSDAAIALAKSLEGKVAAGDLDALTPAAVQALMGALAKFYAASVEAGDKYPVVSHRMAISGTEAMILCGALLKAVDLQVFELGMWQSWSGL